MANDDMKKMPDEYWRKKLTPEQYRVLRERGTEAPGSGKYVDHNADGMYHCAACGQALFPSSAKFESSLPGLRGWPAFWAAAAGDAVELKEDNAFGMNRTEITCARCGSHLGHLFEDDPMVKDKGGKHFCVNSCALDFKPMPKEAK